MPRKVSAPSVPPAIEPLALEEVALEELKPHPQNYRAHPEEQLDHLEASLLAFGVYKNIVIARDNTILAGHGLVESARQLGMQSLPVRRLDLDPADAQALKVLVGDNEIARLALRQDVDLAGLLQGLADAPGGLVGTGFDAESLAALIEQSQNVLSQIEFPEYDESIEKDVEYLECPSCHHRWPK